MADSTWVVEQTSGLVGEASDRIFRLREAYWRGTHNVALVERSVGGCGEDTISGHARDFRSLLQASDPLIQPEELIVGCHLAIPEQPTTLDLGYYNSHYPPGHELILEKGLALIRDMALKAVGTEEDPERADFLQGVSIAYAAACEYVAKYARCAMDLAVREPEVPRRAELLRIAQVCEELASGPPTSFRAALQLFQFVRVLGGSGCIGRFDQWMYPFLSRDLAEGVLTREEAQELLECLFIKLNEFGDANCTRNDGYVPNDDLRNIALAGQTVEGEDACNELTYMCLSASAKLMLPEPKLNVRFFSGSPLRLLQECCRVLSKGANVLAFFNDDVCVPALTGIGVPLADARDYCNDGCSELIIGGKGTISFRVHDALPVLTDTVLAAEGAPYATFEELMEAFKERLLPFMLEGTGGDASVTSPFFAASIRDCLAMASTTGVRYSMWGSILAQVGNAADGMAAIRKLVYEDRVVSWEELSAALRSDYDGYEPLRQRILHRAPKYGNDDDSVDAIAKEIAESFCDGVHLRARNTLGRGGKRAAGLMCFGIHRKRELPASPDGRRQGDLTANSFSPSVGMDKSGPTAVLKSAAKVDLTKASHGSVLDVALHASVFGGEDGQDKLASLVETFFRMPSTATLQLNVIDRDTLLRAREDPDAPEFRTLIVRVWGFSAVFVDLPSDLQDHVLARTEHGLSG